MNILLQTHQCVAQKILPNIPKRHKRLFTFGVQALTLHSFVSLNGNARMTRKKRATAEMTMYRLVRNQAMLSYFPKLVRHLNLVTATDSVNVDFSTFGGVQVLTFAKQTQVGRAVPVYFSLLRYPIQDPGSQTRFVIKTIHTVTKLLGFCPHLVFDRGFESPYIVPYLVKAKIPFTLRVRKDKHVRYMGKDLPLQNLPWDANDCMVSVYQCTLRVVVSDRKAGLAEPWYILTNDTTTNWERVISRYYFRFEIEETFKDLKHVHKLGHLTSIKKLLTVALLLWFYVLAVWLAFLSDDGVAYLIQRVKHKKRKRLSLLRYFFEQLELAKVMLVEEVCAM